MAFSRLAPLLLSLVLGGCALFAPAPDVIPPEDVGFAVRGKVGVRTAEDGFSSSFLWRHSGADYEIELWGPMGQGRTRLEGQGETLTVYAADGEVHRESDSALAMQRWFGFYVPVEVLASWIQGRIAPDRQVENRQSDAAGDLVALEQAGWTLAFSRYSDALDGRRLPGRIVATRLDVRVTLIPVEWSFSPTFQ
jgi:outer membrane lipoprotein LolB